MTTPDSTTQHSASHDMQPRALDAHAQLVAIADTATELLKNFDQVWYDDSDEPGEYDWVGPLPRDQWLAFRAAVEARNGGPIEGAT